MTSGSKHIESHVKNLKKHTSNKSDKELSCEAKTLFPSHPKINWILQNFNVEEYVNFKEELRQASKKNKKRKGTGS